jgi:hypothetical protein
MVQAGYSSLDELDELEARERKEYKKKQGGRPNYLFFLVKYQPLLIILRSTC